MGQIGTWSQYDIPVFERVDVNKPYFPVHLPSGRVGYVAMVPISEATKPYLVAHFRNGRHASTSNPGPKSYVIDNFEDGSLSNRWDDVSTASILEVNSSYALEGTYGLRIGDGLIQSNSGLNYYPKYGDEFEYFFQPTDLGDYANVYWYFDSANNCYQVQQAFGSKYFRVWRTENGNTDYLISVDLRNTAENGYNLYDTYRVTINQSFDTDGTIYATLKNESTGNVLVDRASASDPGPNSWPRDVRLAIDNNSIVYYDGWVATKVGGT